MNEQEKREFLLKFCDWIDNRYLTSKERAVELFLKEQKQLANGLDKGVANPSS